LVGCSGTRMVLPLDQGEARVWGVVTGIVREF
jgi:hypothetical protein